MGHPIQQCLDRPFFMIGYADKAQQLHAGNGAVGALADTDLFALHQSNNCRAVLIHAKDDIGTWPSPDQAGAIPKTVKNAGLM